jgi:hypothetical protein
MTQGIAAGSMAGVSITTARPMGTSTIDRITIPPTFDVPSLISAFQSAWRKAAPRTARKMPRLKTRTRAETCPPHG